MREKFSGRISSSPETFGIRMTPETSAGGCRRVKVSPGSVGGEKMRNFTDLIKALTELVKAITTLINSVKK